MAKIKKRSSSGRFVLGMIVYALVFVLIAAVGMRFLWSYLAEFEKSRPNNTMDEYIRSFDNEHIKKVSESFVGTLNHDIQPEEDSYAYITQAMSGKLTYAKKSAECTEDRTVYILMLDGQKLGKVVLEKQDDPVLGFAPWYVAEEELDFSWLLSTNEITVPYNWTVSCAGYTLNEDYRQEGTKEYKLLEEFYGKEFELPYMVTYGIDSFVGDVQFVVENARGEEVVLDGENDEAQFTDNCTEKEKQEIKQVVDEFLLYYVAFLSNSNHSAWYNYTNLKPYMVENSSLDSAMLQTISGLFYASSRGDNIVSVTMNDCMDLGNGNYLVAVTYVVDTEGSQGIVQTTLNLKIIFSRTEDGLKAADLAQY